MRLDAPAAVSAAAAAVSAVPAAAAASCAAARAGPAHPPVGQVLLGQPRVCGAQGESRGGSGSSADAASRPWRCLSPFPFSPAPPSSRGRAVRAQVHIGVFSESAYAGNALGTDVLSLEPDPATLASPTGKIDGVYTSPEIALSGLDFTLAAVVYVKSLSRGSKIIRVAGGDEALVINIRLVAGSGTDVSFDVR